MKIKIPKQKENLFTLMRKIGYSPDRGNRSSESSFSRPLQGQPYPRFHIYVEDIGEAWVLNLHLDQKKPSYTGSAAHAGEHDSPVVEQEAERIKQALPT